MAHTETTITINWGDVKTICERMSSFEGRNATGADGEHAYASVHIEDQDEDIIYDQIQHGINMLEDALGNQVSGVTAGTDTESGEPNTDIKLIYDNARNSLNTTEKMMTEAVALQVMANWLSETRPSREEHYVQLYEQMLKAIRTNISRKNKPSLDIEY